MFIRQKKSKSGKISVQVILKSKGKFEVIHTLSCTSDLEEVEKLCLKGKHWIEQKMGVQHIDLVSANDRLVLNFLTNGLDWIRPAGADSGEGFTQGRSFATHPHWKMYDSR